MVQTNILVADRPSLALAARNLIHRLSVVRPVGAVIGRFARRIHHASHGWLKQGHDTELLRKVRDRAPVSDVVAREGHSQRNRYAHAGCHTRTFECSRKGTFSSPRVVNGQGTVDAHLHRIDVRQDFPVLWQERSVGAECDPEPKAFCMSDNAFDVGMNQRLTAIETHASGPAGAKIAQQPLRLGRGHLARTALVAERAAQIAPMGQLDVHPEGAMPRKKAAFEDRPRDVEGMEPARG
jgi:hypothetical protein